MSFKCFFESVKGSYAVIFTVSSALELEICVGSHIQAAFNQGLRVAFRGATRI